MSEFNIDTHIKNLSHEGVGRGGIKNILWYNSQGLIFVNDFRAGQALKIKAPKLKKKKKNCTQEPLLAYTRWPFPK